ncbi:iron chelate uptake ABC transporter family permease subunit [Rhizobium sp. G187]|uniref:iron chelate uptake ABC transporter family permease subunit n=1 Tax=Rhizobium sp. G187 TaxID=3451352 RepID=UPI003EE79AD5
MLSRLHVGWVSAARQSLRRWNSKVPVIIVVVGLLMVIAISLFIGRGPGGTLAVVSGEFLGDILAVRTPKVLAAFASGAMLGVAGLILQKLTGNEMASPEVLGISAGATLALRSRFLPSAPVFKGSLSSPSLALLRFSASYF